MNGSVVDRELEAVPVDRRGRRARPRSTSSIEHQSARGLRRARPQPREVEQVVDQIRRGDRSRSMIASRSSTRSLSSIVGEPSASAAARIAVIGVRRSCETVRSRAVLISSLRRSASVSTVALSIASRSIAAASSASRPGTSRSRSRARFSGSIPVGHDQRPQPVARRGSAAGRAFPGLISHVAALQWRPTAARARWRSARPPMGSAAPRSGPPSSIRGELRHQVGLPAPGLGLLGPAARQLGERARDRRGDEEGRQRHPVPRVGDREPADRRVGGRS